jgi:uncharacterized LabA/DUF88 family protein
MRCVRDLNICAFPPRMPRTFVRAPRHDGPYVQSGEEFSRHVHRTQRSFERAARTCHLYATDLFLGHNSPAMSIPRGRISGGGRKRFAKQAAARRLCLFDSPHLSDAMRTVVYVDGFNLYYGVLRGTPFKWLDLYALFRDQLLDPAAHLEQVRYYTAPVRKSSSDDPESVHRQQFYLRALEAYRGSRVQIVRGFISRTMPRLRLVNPPQDSRATTAQVFQFTEKQTDVNLTADLISDAWHGRYEQAVVCSNDCDLVGALRAVRRDHAALTIGLVAPLRHERYLSADLRHLAHWHKILTSAHLAHAQLPVRIPGTSLKKPEAWNDTAADTLRQPE